MTTTTAPRDRAPRSGRADRQSAVDAFVLRSQLRWLAFASMWVWLGFWLFAWGITRSNDATVGVSESVVGSLSVTPRQFLFAYGIVIVAAWFVPHVASGRPRRSLATTSAAAVLVMAASYGVLLAVAFWVERPVFEARGWPLTIRTGHVFARGDEVALVLTESVLVAAALGLAGLAVGAGYRRLGGWGGTFALPLTAGPMLAATAVLELRASSGLGAALGVEGLSAPATFAALAALGVISLLTTYRMLHGAPATTVSSIEGPFRRSS